MWSNLLHSLQMKETLVDAEIKLAEWKNKLKELHSKYTWLPFLSVKKVILVHNLLSEHPTKKVIRELRTLQQNDETIGQIIEVITSTCMLHVYNRLRKYYFRCLAVKNRVFP